MRYCCDISSEFLLVGGFSYLTKISLMYMSVIVLAYNKVIGYKSVIFLTEVVIFLVILEECVR